MCWRIVAGLLFVAQCEAYRPLLGGEIRLRLPHSSAKCRLRRLDESAFGNIVLMTSRIAEPFSCKESAQAFQGLLPFQTDRSKLLSAFWASVLTGAMLLNPVVVPAEQPSSNDVTSQQIQSPVKDAEHQFLDEVLNTVEEHFLDLNNQKGVADSSRSKIFNGLSWADVRKQFAETELSNRDDTYSQIKKLLAKLGDKYTRFMPPKEFAKLTKYDITGVGVLLIEKDGRIFLAAPPLAGSTGAEAGLQKGDRVISIDGVDLDRKTPFEAAERLTGQAGTKVALRIERQGGSGPFEVTLERRISVKNPVRTFVVTAKDGRPVGYMKMTEFNAASRRGVAEAVSELREVGVSDLVLDLRGNPGGVLEGALQIAGLFLTQPPPSTTATSSLAPPPESQSVAAGAPSAASHSARAASGVVSTPQGATAAPARAAPQRTLVYVMDRNGREESIALPPRAALDGSTPLIILMDGRSASASEVLAGSLRDNCRAAIVGAGRSYGKGLIQGAFPLSDGSGVVVTVAKYLTPKHVDIQGQGLVPDLATDVGPGRAAIRSGRLDVAAAERRVAACEPPPPDAEGKSGGREVERSGSDKTLERLNGPSRAPPPPPPPSAPSLFSRR